jgi:PAS domain S-box-containing protein
MARIHARLRIPAIQVGLATTIIMLGFGLKFFNEPIEEGLQERARLCELAAAYGNIQIQQGQLGGFEEVVRFLVDRNDELLSAGIRYPSGALALEIGEHSRHWPTQVGAQSTDTYMHVPLYDERDELWGRLELRFRPLQPPHPVLALFTHPWARFLLFFSSLTYVAFYWHLSRTLHHLDPTKAVPKGVRSAYDFLAGGLVALDSNQRIVLSNKSFLEIVGLPRERLLGSKLDSLNWIHPNPQDAEFLYPWERVHRTRHIQLGTSLRFDSKALGVRTLMVNAAPVVGQDGHYHGILVGFDDITPLEHAKAALEKSKEAAEAASVAKSAFLANMSHEIRTPMNAILGFADVLRRGFVTSPEERQQYLDIIHSSGQHLLDLINDILDLSKVESGRMKFESINCHPHQIIHDVLSIFRVRAGEKNISLHFRIVGRIPETITSDPLRLRQILTNLVGNAIKFTDKGGIEIHARVANAADGRQLLAFDVIDTGVGIPADKISCIFTPFSQADTSTTRNYGGTGLGLSISRKFARLMGGDITVKSIPGKGSTFTATIDPGPIDKSRLLSHEDVEVLRSAATKTEAIQYDLPNGHVLLVDDGESNRKLARLVLERSGVKVDTASNGADAVRLALAHAYDIIFMDVQMPVMDGYTAAKTLRERGIDIPIVAMTAHAMKEHQEKCLRTGYSHVLPKPVDIDDLLELTNRLLGAAEPLRARTASRPSYLAANGRPASSVCNVSEAPGQAAPVDPIRAVKCSLPLDDPEFLEIAREFVQRLDERIREMAALWCDEDYEGLAKLAHWLKGAGGTAGFGSFTLPARSLEVSAQAKKRFECEILIDEIQQLCKRIELPESEHGEEPTMALAASIPQSAG